MLPAGTLARCASAPALRRVLPPYCLVDEHDPRALQPGEAAADSLHSSVAWYCTFDNDTLQRIGQKVINVFPGAGGFRMGFVRERVDPRPGSVRIGNYMCVWHDHTFTEHQAGKIRNKLLREWEWAEVSASDIDPAFRALYREHVGDRYGDADGSSRGRTVTTPLFGDPNALV